MHIKNNGIGESNVLQNQFTAYLQLALLRTRQKYSRKKQMSELFEIQTDFSEQQVVEIIAPEALDDLIEGLPIYEKIENQQLRDLLQKAKERDRLILFRKILEEQTFMEIAEELSIPSKTVSTIYYRLLSKLRKEMSKDEL